MLFNYLNFLLHMTKFVGINFYIPTVIKTMRVALFSWNSHRINFMEKCNFDQSSHVDNNQCKQLDFWPLLSNKIIYEYDIPDLVVYCTQEESSDSQTHTTILPGHMSWINYDMYASKYVHTDNKEILQTSVFMSRDSNLPRSSCQVVNHKSKMLLEWAGALNFSRKNGGFEFTLECLGLTISIVNVHLPRNNYLNNILFNNIVSQFYFRTPSPDVYFMVGSFNPTHNINNNSLPGVLEAPLDYHHLDSLHQKIKSCALNEGIDGQGANFAPTCKLSPKRDKRIPSPSPSPLHSLTNMDITDIDDHDSNNRYSGYTSNSGYSSNDNSDEDDMIDIKLSLKPGMHHNTTNIGTSYNRSSVRKFTRLPPTSYKPNIGDFNRTWQWCDRILYGTHHPQIHIHCDSYDRIDDPSTSLKYMDHAIVCGLYTININDYNS